MTLFPGAERHSITHHHLFGVLATQVMRRAPPAGRTIRILDMGCGSGQLLAFLQSALERRFASLSFELHGLDVTDSRVQKEDFSPRRSRCSAPGIRRSIGEPPPLLSSTEPWPQAADSFDFVISNQVIEHVRDHDRLLADVARVLKADGLSVHLFPLGMPGSNGT